MSQLNENPNVYQLVLKVRPLKHDSGTRGLEVEYVWNTTRRRTVDTGTGIFPQDDNDLRLIGKNLKGQNCDESTTAILKQKGAEAP